MSSTTKTFAFGPMVELSLDDLTSRIENPNALPQAMVSSKWNVAFAYVCKCLKTAGIWDYEDQGPFDDALESSIRAISLIAQMVLNDRDSPLGCRIPVRAFVAIKTAVETMEKHIVSPSPVVEVPQPSYANALKLGPFAPLDFESLSTSDNAPVSAFGNAVATPVAATAPATFEPVSAFGSAFGNNPKAATPVSTTAPATFEPVPVFGSAFGNNPKAATLVAPEASTTPVRGHFGGFPSSVLTTDAAVFRGSVSAFDSPTQAHAEPTSAFGNATKIPASLHRVFFQGGSDALKTDHSLVRHQGGDVSILQGLQPVQRVDTPSVGALPPPGQPVERVATPSVGTCLSPHTPVPKAVGLETETIVLFGILCLLMGIGLGIGAMAGNRDAIGVVMALITVGFLFVM
jgi:hypothetical protein